MHLHCIRSVAAGADQRDITSKYTSYYKHTSRSPQMHIQDTCNIENMQDTTLDNLAPDVPAYRYRLPQIAAGTLLCTEARIPDRTRLFFPHFHAVPPGPCSVGYGESGE